MHLACLYRWLPFHSSWMSSFSLSGTYILLLSYTHTEQLTHTSQRAYGMIHTLQACHVFHAVLTLHSAWCMELNFLVLQSFHMEINIQTLRFGHLQNHTKLVSLAVGTLSNKCAINFNISHAFWVFPMQCQYFSRQRTLFSSTVFSA